MNEFIKLILSLSLSGSLLILLLILLRPVYRNRLSKNWQYYIWLVVILRLLLPVTPETSLMGTLFSVQEQRSADNLTVPETAMEQAETFYGAADTGSAVTDRHDVGNTTAENNSPAAAFSPDTATDHESIGRVLFLLWLVVTLLLFVRKLTVYQSFVKYVDAGSRPLEDIGLLERFGLIMEQHQIKGFVDLRINSLVSSPLLVGFLHPRIILPHTDLSESDFYYTALHELTHYRRRDMFYKWLVQITVCLHWFNPFVYLMCRETNRLCELSCDERVIDSIPEDARKSYGTTLVNAVGAGGSYKDTLASVTLNESKELLKGRLDAIMKYKKLSKLMRYATLFITGILIGSAVVLGAYAAPSGRPDNGTGTAPDGGAVPDAAKTGDSSDNTASTTNSLPDYHIQYEDDGIYYIYVDGAEDSDKPLSNVSNGFHKLVFVWKDRYTTFGTFRPKDMSGLVRHIETQCRTLLDNGQITQEDMNLFLQAAKEIQDSYKDLETQTYTAYHFNVLGPYYQKPYIIELGYGQQTLSRNDYRSMTVTLSDQSNMPVYYKAEYEQALSDKETLYAVTAALERMLARTNADDAEYAVIINMEYVGDADLSSLAAKYYPEEDPTLFTSLFRELDNREKMQYLDRMFEDDKIDFFCWCIGEVETEQQKEAVADYALRAYQNDNIDFFAALIGMIDTESQMQWQAQCKGDGKDDYFWLFPDNNTDDYEDFDDFNDFNDFDAFNDFNDFNDHGSDSYYLGDYLEDRGLLREYNENGIVTIKDAYYYQNARVRILMDVRTDGSFENFDYNDQGTVDLRLVRNQNNEIARVEYLSAEESAEIIEDLYDTLDGTADENITPRSPSSPVVDVTRVTRDEVSEKIRNALDTCETGKWYVIESDGSEYIYYKGLPNTYAYEPQIDGSENGDLITVNIMDIKSTSPLLSGRKATGDYVLLAFSYSPSYPDTACELSIRYNHIPVTYTRSQADQA